MYEFDACFAIRCPRCRDAFCAWCFLHIRQPTNPHLHVVQCPKRRNGDNYYGTPEQFNASNRARQREQLVEYLATLPRTVEAQVRDSLFARLKEFGLWSTR